jgi:hypothetical protein
MILISEPYQRQYRVGDHAGMARDFKIIVP